MQVVAHAVHAEARQTRSVHPRQQLEDRQRLECERLRRCMPEANLWTIEVTAQILVARGLDQSGEGMWADARRGGPYSGDGVARGSLR